MSVDAHEESPVSQVARPKGRGLRERTRPLRRTLAAPFSSSLTRRIVFLNLGGLLLMLLGFLYLNQFREGLIAARIKRA